MQPLGNFVTWLGNFLENMGGKILGYNSSAVHAGSALYEPWLPKPVFILAKYAEIFSKKEDSDMIIVFVILACRPYSWESKCIIFLPQNLPIPAKSMPCVVPQNLPSHILQEIAKPSLKISPRVAQCKGLLYSQN